MKNVIAFVLVLSWAFLTPLPASGFSPKLDSYCANQSKKGSSNVEACRASEKHYKGQASRLRTWATSEQSASCERQSSTYRSMAYCLNRAIGNRGPGVQPWNP